MEKLTKLDKGKEVALTYCFGSYEARITKVTKTMVLVAFNSATVPFCNKIRNGYLVAKLDNYTCKLPWLVP